MLRPAFIQIKQYKIAYYDSAGPGTPVLFLHGNSLSSQTFVKVFNHQLLHPYRLIALDLPGHGFSSWSKDPGKDYTIPALSAIIREFIEALSLPGMVVVGHCLGGHLAMEIAASYPVKGLFIFGAPPLSKNIAFNKAFLPELTIDFYNNPDLSQDKINALVQKLIFRPDPILQNFLTRLILQSDPNIRGTLTNTIVLGNYTDEVEIVKNVTIPLAILSSVHEPFVNREYYNTLDLPTLWQNEIMQISEAGHVPQLENETVFCNLLKNFILTC